MHTAPLQPDWSTLGDPGAPLDPDPPEPGPRDILDWFQARQREEEERAAQEPYDDHQRRSQAARDKIRREREEAELTGELTGEAQAFHDLRLRPLISDARAYEPKQRIPVVQGLLNRNSLAWVAGPSGTFKSFMTADLAFRYGAPDMDYHGRKMTHGRALVIIAEGEDGYAHRRVAWEKQYEREVKNVDFYPGALQLGNIDRDMPALLRLLRDEEEAGDPYGLIVIDTQAMCTVGVDENSSEMNLVINVLHRIRHVSGACVLAVHHFGKNKSAGMRGSSMQYAAADTIIILKRDPDAMTVRLSTAQEDEGKQKDLPTERDLLTLDMRFHVTGTDYFGDEVTSLVAVEAVAPAPGDAPEAEPLPDLADIDLFYLKALGTYAEDGAKPGEIRTRILEAAEDESDEYHAWLRIPEGHAVKAQTPSSRLQRLKAKGLADKDGRERYVITVRGHQVIAREVTNRQRTEDAWSLRARPRRYSRMSPGGAYLPVDNPVDNPDFDRG